MGTRVHAGKCLNLSEFGGVQVQSLARGLVPVTFGPCRISHQRLFRGDLVSSVRLTGDREMSADANRSQKEVSLIGLSDIAALVLLLSRGLLLWLVVPLGSIVWALVISWRGKVSLGQFLGWLDLNLVAALQRSLLRLLLQRPTVEFQPLRNMAGTTHRMRTSDPL